MRKASPKKWNHKQHSAFVNAIREVLGKAPIPYSQRNDEPYSGVQLYGAESRRVSSRSVFATMYEPL